jgi:acid phosphatase class B
LLDLKQSLKSQSKDFNIEKHEDKIIVNNYNKTIYNKQVTYAMDKKFEIYYSDFRTIPINF